MSADPQALQKDIAADRQEAISRQSALDTARQQSATQREGELAPMEAGVSKEIDQLGAVKPPPKADLPTYQPKPLVDPNEYQKFSGALLGMALIAGIASKGNWMGVTASLNGALKGHLEGDQARAEKDWQDYKTKFDEAKAKSEAQQKEFADILQNKRLTINDMLTQIKIASAKYGRDDTKFEAEQKSIDGIWKRIESMDTSLTRISDMDQRQRRQIDARFQMQKIAQSGGAEQLTGAGQEFAIQAMQRGDPEFVNDLKSRFGAKQIIPLLNKMADQGVDPGDPIAARKFADAYGSTLRQATQRKAGVERLTKSVQTMESRIDQLVAKVNGDGNMSLNEIFNKVKTELGDKDLSELKTLMGATGRQYIESVTMPGSNAQLHATTQDWADGLFSPAINNQNWAGIKKAINEEVAATHSALEGTQADLGQAIRAGTQPGREATPPAHPNSSPVKPFADPDKERRYQEWKRDHPNGN
jgi:hypothetical protein